MGAAKWTENYGVNSLTLAGVLQIVVDWKGSKEGGFVVSCGGRRMKKKFTDVEEAKKAGLRLARTLVGLIVTELDELGAK